MDDSTRRGRKPTELTEQDMRQIAAEYEAGASTVATCRKWHIADERLRMIVETHGGRIRPPRWKGGRAPLTSDRIRILAETQARDGVIVPRLWAERWGISQDRVRQLAEMAGAQVGPHGGRRRGRARGSGDRI